jgi:hypothetical protein
VKNNAMKSSSTPPPIAMQVTIQKGTLSSDAAARVDRYTFPPAQAQSYGEQGGGAQWNKHPIGINGYRPYIE